MAVVHGKINDVMGNKSDSNTGAPGTGTLYSLAGHMGYYHEYP